MQTYEITKALILNQKGELLLVRRSKTDRRRPGQWDLPGGRVDPGEDIREALAREIQEETGIDAERKKLRLVYGTSKVRESVSVTWTFFILQLEETPEVTLSFEHTEHRWIVPQAALEEIEYDLHKEVLEYVLQNGLLGAAEHDAN